jgi:hypothetical protein
MTSRDRLFAFLKNEPLDRVPMWMLFPYHTVPYYADIHTDPAYRPVVDLALETAVWLDRRGFGAQVFSPEVEERREEIVRGGERVQRHVLTYAGVELCAEWYPDAPGRKAKKLLASEEDLERLAQFPFQTDPAVINAELDGQIARWRREVGEFPAHLGAMMNSMGEPIGFIHGQADVEELSVWSLTAPDLIVSLLDRLQEHYRLVYRHLLEEEVGEVYFMVGSELTAPPLVSLSTFQRWIVPYAEELITLVHEYDRHVIQHFHGQIRELLPDFVRMAPDALHTIEAPPTGNCTLTEAFAVVGDRIGLIGNIQYDDFHRLTPDEMTAAVRAVRAETQGKRFMLSPTAGPYESNPPPRVIDNYLAFMRSQ